MAYVKIIPIRTKLNRAINYVLNADKTGLDKALDYIFDSNKTTDKKHVVYESAINCQKNRAYQNMISTKKRFSKIGGVLGYHIIHSYKPNEVTPKLAHKVGLEFANKCFGDKYECIIGTHVDKGHIHNHITINSVSFIDGSKYRNNFKDYFHDMRGISNEICLKHGLSVITPQEEKKAISYFEWQAKNKGRSSWSLIIKNDIDHAISQAFSYGNFLMILETMGYELKQGKYLSVRPFGKDRFSRTYKLGEEYSEQSIKNRVINKDLSIMPSIKRHSYKEFQKRYKSKGKILGFKALCYHYMFLLGTIKKNEAPTRITKEFKEELLKFDKMARLYDFIHDRNLKTQEDINDYKADVIKTIDLLVADKKSHKKDLSTNSSLYTALLDYKRYAKANDMFKDGYKNMEHESNLYLNAKQILSDNGYINVNDLKKLEQEYSLHLERVSKYDKDIRYYRKELRLCDSAINFKKHAEKQIEKWNNIDNQINQQDKGGKSNESRS